ncbi:MAG: hypothetical protein RL115_357 [Bacteroidota bacterium]
MKHHFFSHIVSLALLVSIVFIGCKKINESTDLGDGLIPTVDNITTFEQYLDVVSDNQLFNDTAKVAGDDYLAIGYTNDPDFGQTAAKAYFDLGMSSYMQNPFVHKDSVVGIDSVVLSLAYNNYYGDTNASQTIRVYEIATNAAFQDTTSYRYNHPDFLTTGAELGNKTFQVKNLDDSIEHRHGSDTLKRVNVIRIKLNNNLGERFKLYDTTNTLNGAFRSDSAFKKAFKGVAIIPDNSGNALTYIDASVPQTGLIVYCRIKRAAGVIDTTSVLFNHFGSRIPYASSLSSFSIGQANTISRSNGGPYLTYLNNGLPSDDKIYLQSTLGSYGSIFVPALDTFRNAVIHKAELILSPIPSSHSGTFRFPTALLLDNVNTAMDTAFTFDNDMAISPSSLTSFSYDFASFGGLIKSDSTYRFNVARYVQAIVTKRNPNRKWRLYSPVRSTLYSPLLTKSGTMFINDKVAFGRVVFAGGNYADATKRVRLRIVYSKL